MFAIISCISFVIPTYWFPGLGGLLSLIGTSTILCCAGNKQGGHVACAVLCIVAACLHAVGVGLLIWIYITFMSAVSDVGSGPVEASAIATSFAAGFVNILIWPAMIVQIIALILEIIQVVFCFRARKALLSSDLPTLADKVQA